MKNSRGLSFQVAGTKRAVGSASAGPKKPVSVKDLFSADSDDEQIEGEAGPKKLRLSSSRAEPIPPVPPAPADPEVQKVADKLAEFVAKNGRGFEDVTRQRNPGNTPFKFLFDQTCAEYKYYEYKVTAFSAKLGLSTASNTPGAGSRSVSGSHSNARLDQTPSHPHLNSTVAKHVSSREFESQRARKALAVGDSVAAMNAYMHLAARKDKSKTDVPEDVEEEVAVPPPAVSLNETGFDRRKVVAVIKPDGLRGHHMQDFIPPEEMAKFLAKCGDSEAAAAAAAHEQKAAIGADNIGHKLLQKMGWKDGEGIGASGTGRTVPVQAAGVKQDNLGIGATAVGDVSQEDDIYEQYRKRMMLGYKFRPNPLGNPRKAYY